MVAVATDRFSAEKTHAGRQRDMDHIAEWFTCYSFTDLMCVQSKGIQALAGSDPSALRGVLQFDGIEKVLTSCVKPWMFGDPAELILNTTELRTGRIYALSDQNELTKPVEVVRGALASALLPLIGEPVKVAPGNHSQFDVAFDEADPDGTEQAYLDGGIRSELPILPLVRRGAERVLAVGSGASMINETKRIPSALGIAARYIGVNNGAVMETEIDYSQRLAESVRLAEINACMSALDPQGDPTVRAICDQKPGARDQPFCSRWNICHGDLASACTFASAEDFAKKRDEDTKASAARRLEPFWKMTAIFVDQENVDGLAGYNFRPSSLRRLFRAGTEAARVRCVDIASLLGILPSDRKWTSGEIEDVNRWCNARMEDVPTTCKGRLPPDGDFEVRACKMRDKHIDLGVLPAYLDACPNEEPQ
jgi:hypothetical protein